MEIKEIINELSDGYLELPKEAIIEARKNKEEITEYLLKELEEIKKDIDRADESQLYFFGMYLLGEFKEKRAFKLIINIIKELDNEDLNYIFDDMICDGLSEILASTYDGDFNLLYDIIEDEEKDEFIRSECLNTLAILYKNNSFPEESFIKLLKDIINKQENNDVIEHAITIVSDHRISELIPDVEKAYKENRVDAVMIDNFNYFKKSFGKLNFEDYEYMEDCIKFLSSQGYLKQETIIKEKKIGRNEPCPCGSGYKYKKCCGKSV